MLKSVSTTNRRRMLVSTVSAAALVTAAATPVLAQAQQQAQAAVAEEIVVTGTRVVRDGYQAPTPLTVVGIEELLRAPAENLADFVNELPSVANSITPQGSSTSASSGTAGVNSINLRALGSNRTLVLVDGQRSVVSTATGVVDVNNFPQMLVERVDVVTGGASAAYGSDAISGVVNFILDKDFTGVKASVEGGLTTYGDGGNWKVALAGGTAFANERGHIIMSGELADRSGIREVPSNRDWNNQGCYLIINPAYVAGNGAPEYLRTCGAALSQATLGGIITNTGVAGIAFGPGGVPYQFNYGAQRRDPWMIGGEWQSNQFNNAQALDPTENRQGFFTRVGYDLADNVEVFGQFAWNTTNSDGITGYQFNQGNINIRADNAFIPDSVRQRLVALNITQFSLGSMNGDLPLRLTDNARTTVRYVVGINGDFDAMDTTWSWDAYYQMGITRTHESVADITNNARLANATDSIRHPTTGTIVCRINGDTNPANDDPACVPFNRMGIGVNTQASLNYFLDSPYRNQRFKQDVAAFSMSGEPFDLWAGPVSVAFGGEHRIEEISGLVDPAYTAGWFVGNFLPSFGKYNVTEGFIEAVIPLIEQQLDLNAAVRFTDYSTSGYVTTYKVGSTWSPVPDIRFRGTYSRDIRAGNLQELFAAGTSNTNNVVDPFNGNRVIQYTGFNTGNPNLRPEKADTIGLGVVLAPSFIPGFQASIDYFNIEVKDAIGTVGAQNIVDFCFQGIQQYCTSITRGTAPDGTPIISRISISPFNLAVREARGMDFDVSYRFSVSDVVDSWSGDMSLRFLASRYTKNYTDDGLVLPTDTAGQNDGNGPPTWTYRASLNYRLDPFDFTLTGRGVSSGTLLNSYVQCTTGCPASTASNRTINDNHLPGALYFDANFAYEIRSYADDGMDIEAFLNIKNLTNKDPAIVPFGPAGSAYGTISTNQGTYDALGRVFRTGLRFRM